MKFKAVLFDLDGTLLDTLDDLADSMNSVLERFGYPTHEVAAYKYFVGKGFRNLVHNTFPEYARDDAAIERGISAMREEYAKRWDNKTKPYPGINSLLDALTQKGLKIAILSNKADDFTNRIVKKLLPDWHFELVYGERTGIPRKPDPSGALEIAQKLGVQPCECLYLGDTGVDMKTAVSAGMYPVGVLWGFRKAEELAADGARVLIADPAATLDLL